MDYHHPYAPNNPHSKRLILEHITLSFHKQARTLCTNTKQFQEFWWIIKLTEGFILRQKNRLHYTPQSQFSLSKKSHCFVIHYSFPRSPLQLHWSWPSWPTSGKISPVLLLSQIAGRKPKFLGSSDYFIYKKRSKSILPH